MNFSKNLQTLFNIVWTQWILMLNLISLTKNCLLFFCMSYLYSSLKRGEKRKWKTNKQLWAPPPFMWIPNPKYRNLSMPVWNQKQTITNGYVADVLISAFWKYFAAFIVVTRIKDYFWSWPPLSPSIKLCETHRPLLSASIIIHPFKLAGWTVTLHPLLLKTNS